MVEIVQALKNLGYEDVEPERIKIASYGKQHSVVLNGEYVGVWDDDLKRIID